MQPSHDTREPASSFVPRMNKPFMDYLRRSDIALATTDLEALGGAVEACDA